MNPTLVDLPNRAKIRRALAEIVCPILLTAAAVVAAVYIANAPDALHLAYYALGLFGAMVGVVISFERLWKALPQIFRDDFHFSFDGGAGELCYRVRRRGRLLEEERLPLSQFRAIEVIDRLTWPLGFGIFGIPVWWVRVRFQDGTGFVVYCSARFSASEKTARRIAALTGVKPTGADDAPFELRIGRVATEAPKPKQASAAPARVRR
jgi:hypothetical protein